MQNNNTISKSIAPTAEGAETVVIIDLIEDAPGTSTPVRWCFT